MLNVQNVECYVVETNYITQCSSEDIHLSEKERANFMKKSSELGTTSDLVVVHTLICSLWGRIYDRSSQLDNAYTEFYN